MEIGSDFSYVNKDFGDGLRLPKSIDDYVFTFSGRTAIETVIRNEKRIHKVYMPSYCCDSMIEPFRYANIEIDFYEVNYEDCLKVDLNIPDDVDCVLWCNYFGFNVEMPSMKEFIDRGGILIEDITHSLFSKTIFHIESKYLVGSIRKWIPILSGGYCASLERYLDVKPNLYPVESFVRMKAKAMDLKAKYLRGEMNISKNEFLSMFKESNRLLEENYSNRTIDKESMGYLCSLDQSYIINKRKKNAEVLYSELKSNRDIKFLFDFDSIDCPLFVPIVVLNGKRDEIHKKLIENNIYCPIHWERPKHGCNSNLYDLEISLICDQRYSENDMQKIISVIQE